MLAQVEAHTEIEKHLSPIDRFEMSLEPLHQTFHVFPTETAAEFKGLQPSTLRRPQGLKRQL